MPAGKDKVRKEHEKEGDSEEGGDQDLGRQESDKDGLIPDFPEPEPIHIEREGIGDGEEKSDKQNDD